jgi:myosin-9
LNPILCLQIFSPEELLPVDISNNDPKPTLLNPDDEEALLMGHIQEIQKEKALLASTLPSLTRTTSDDDLLSTDMDDGSLDDVTGQLEEGEQERKSACAVYVFRDW